MKKNRRKLLKSDDPRCLPSYRIPEAAHYLRLPATTIRSWTLGQKYRTDTKVKVFEAVINIAERNPPVLSFINLIEIHVLSAIRRIHNIPLPKVREALMFVRDNMPSQNPLADHQFETDGIDLFLEKFGVLINITSQGQTAIRSLLEAHLRRIERDGQGIPIKLYPFTRKHEIEEPKAIVIDPFISFGRPVLCGTGIATSVIAERYKAGESIDELADDYGRERSEIEEAIRCELYIEAA